MSGGRRRGASHAGWTDAELEDAYAAAAKAGIVNNNYHNAPGGRSARHASGAPSRRSAVAAAAAMEGKAASGSSGGRGRSSEAPKSSRRGRGRGGATAAGGRGRGRGAAAIDDEVDDDDDGLDDDEKKKLKDKKKMTREQYRGQQEALRLGFGELSLADTLASSRSDRRDRGRGKVRPPRGSTTPSSPGAAMTPADEAALWYNNEDFVPPSNHYDPYDFDSSLRTVSHATPSSTTGPSTRSRGRAVGREHNINNIDSIHVPIESADVSTSSTKAVPLPTEVDDVTAYRARMGAADQKRADEFNNNNNDSKNDGSQLSSNGMEVLDHNQSAASGGFRYRDTHHRVRDLGFGHAAAGPSALPSSSAAASLPPSEAKRRNGRNGHNGHESDHTNTRGSRGGSRRHNNRHSHGDAASPPAAAVVDDSNWTQEQKDAEFARQLMLADEKSRADQIAADERMAASLDGRVQNDQQASQDLILAMRLQAEGSRPSSASPYIHRHPHHHHGMHMPAHGAGITHYYSPAGRGRGVVSSHDPAVLEVQRLMAMQAMVAEITAIDESSILGMSPMAIRSNGGRGRGIVALGHAPIVGDSMSFESLSRLEDVAAGVGSAQLHAFPVRTLKHKDEIKALGTGNNSCSICISEFEVSEEIMTVPCLHHFHPACITTWLEKKKTCPLCVTRLDVNHT